MRHLLAMVYGIGVLCFAALVCYVSGIYFDRKLHDFMSDEEYERSHHGHQVSNLIGAGMLGLMMCGCVLVLIWLLGAPIAGVFPFHQ